MDNIQELKLVQNENGTINTFINENELDNILQLDISYKGGCAGIADVIIKTDAKLEKTFETKAKIKEVHDINFGQALEALKEGKKVARSGWNGKGQYIELATNISYKNSEKEEINAEHKDIGNKAIAFVGTSGIQLGWLASQADMLAEDWNIMV